MGFPDSRVGKESARNEGDPSSIPGLGRSTGEGIGYPLQYSCASLVAQCYIYMQHFIIWKAVDLQLPWVTVIIVPIGHTWSIHSDMQVRKQGRWRTIGFASFVHHGTTFPSGHSEAFLGSPSLFAPPLGCGSILAAGTWGPLLRWGRKTLRTFASFHRRRLRYL